MEDNQHSRTAIFVAIPRINHTMYSSDPILDESVGRTLLNEEEIEQFSEFGFQLIGKEKQKQLKDASDQERFQASMQHGAFGAATIARNRFAEDCLREGAESAGIEQYVIIGAGLDTFAFRRPGWARDLTIIELDHPATQAFKKERLEMAGLKPPGSLHFVPVDLTKESVASALEGTAYDPDSPSFFSWLGVTIYLPRPVVFRTLESIREAAAPESRLVFDVLDGEGANPGTTSDRLRRFMGVVEEMGEPIQDGLDVDSLEEDLQSRGFRLLELLTPEGQQRYFDDQPDHLGPTEYYHFAHAAIESD